MVFSDESIPAGADLDVLSEDGFPLLTKAVRHRMPDIASPLLDYCADPNLLGLHGHTALCLAIGDSLREDVIHLLDTGADPDVLMNSGILLLGMAASLDTGNCLSDIVLLFLKSV